MKFTLLVALLATSQAIQTEKRGGGGGRGREGKNRDQSPIKEPEMSYFEFHDMSNTVTCPGMEAEEYCNCEEDCFEVPRFCQCEEAVACCKDIDPANYAEEEEEY